MNQLWDFFSRLLDYSDWPPRWHCGRWTEFHGWLYIISDLLIWSAYFSIPVVILRYIAKKQGVRFIRLYFLFAAFILACGATHLLDAVAFWFPAYRLNALVRFITGILSWITVFYLVRLLPLAFSLKTQSELEAEIAQRKKAEEEVKLLNARLEQFVLARTEELSKSIKEIADYKYALDQSSIVAITNQKGIITHVNDNFCKISKYSVGELIGQDHRIINSGHHSKAFIRELWVTIANGQIWRGELKNRAKDGSIYWVDTTIIPFLDERGKPYQYVAIRADITSRKQAEEALYKLNQELESRVNQRTIQLEAATKEMEAFTYSVSHDLRAPLRGIVGFASILEEDYSDKLDTEAKRITGIIKNNTLKMGQLIDDLLAFSRMGRQDMPKTGIDMQALVQEIIQELASGGTYEPAVEWEIQALPRVQADMNTIRQVWVNLLSNAIKYSGKKECPRIAIGSFIKGEQIVFFVRDNGIGFDYRYRDKLFKVFQRLHSPSQFEGTGVGLALVAKIISKHGGQVWAEGEVGQGACFYFSLPID